MEEVKGEWGNAPLNPALMSAWQAENQAQQEEYGSPDAGGGGDGSQDGGGDTAEDGMFDGGDKPDEGDQPDGGQDMAKSFGLPVFTVVP